LVCFGKPKIKHRDKKTKKAKEKQTNISNVPQHLLKNDWRNQKAGWHRWRMKRPTYVAVQPALYLFFGYYVTRWATCRVYANLLLHQKLQPQVVPIPSDVPMFWC